MVTLRAERLYSDYRDELVTYAAKRVSEIIAEDIVQEVFPNARLISLQKGRGMEQLDQVRHLFHVKDFSRELDEQAGPFMDTAAIMMNLSLVITSIQPSHIWQDRWGCLFGWHCR